MPRCRQATNPTRSRRSNHQPASIVLLLVRASVCAGDLCNAEPVRVKDAVAIPSNLPACLSVCPCACSCKHDRARLVQLVIQRMTEHRSPFSPKQYTWSNKPQLHAESVAGSRDIL